MSELPLTEEAYLLDALNPREIAYAFLEKHYDWERATTLRYFRKSFYHWGRHHWEAISIDRLSSQLWEWCAQQFAVGSERKSQLFRPNTRIIKDVLEALKAATYLEATDVPTWIGSVNGAETTFGVVSFKNGLVQLKGRILRPHNPYFFNHSYIGFDYTPDAPFPERWISFLESVWPSDPEAIGCLQEWFGYIISRETSQQKILLLEGPPRSGKGIIISVLRLLIGPEFMCNPTLASLGQQFGLASLIGKLAAVITDARLNGRVDLSAVTENLLRISGEDPFSVPVKFEPDWIGRLPARIIVCTNELPTFNDASGALPSRIIVLRMTKSFLGKEDPFLIEKLKPELPSIMNWALDGLDRLRARGKLIQPKSGIESAEHLDSLGSPVKSFIRDRCIIEDEATVSRLSLYEEWCRWCQVQGRHPGNQDTFGRNLRAAIPGLSGSRLRSGTSRIWAHKGVRLRRPDDKDLEDLGLAGLSGLPGLNKERAIENSHLKSPTSSAPRSVSDHRPARPTIPAVQEFSFLEAPQ